MVNSNTAISQLDATWQTLRQRWEHAKTLWNDSVRRGFEEDYWTPLEKQTQATQREVERLAQVIAKARQSVK